ncbi:MAG TPA: Uma2 family endonuclease [Chthonomonadaceae bacterium]|nr:Uma2 family endonuclease [Chthonomonadaceae bacterium]
MSHITVETTEAVEGRIVQFAERPIRFDAFLQLSGDSNLELVNGVMVEKMAVQLTHEKLFAWLLTLLNLYTKHKHLGIILGSRTAVEISPFGGRLPDILFVCQDRLDIIREKAVYGAPDLVIEIVSPNDRPSDIIALETDYRLIGVPEIWFIDPQKQRVRVLRKREQDYTDEVLMADQLSSEAVEGFHVEVEWLLHEPRPDELDTLTQLLSENLT